MPVNPQVTLFTCLGPWLLLEHRSCKTSLQRLLSWAILSSFCQLRPVCVCLKITSPGVFRSPPLSLALRVPRQGPSRNIGIWLSQCVTKPYPYSLKNVYMSLRTWFVLSQRSLLLTLSIHSILNIFHNH